MMSQEILYLENRKILKISGLNCVDFLNNILTSDISKLTPLETIPSALLSPQGRVLFDLLVSLDFQNYSKEKSILIEYDLFCKDELMKKLKMYNLRKEVNIEKTKYNVLVTLDKANSNNLLLDKRFAKSGVNVGRIYEENYKKSLNNKRIVTSKNWYDLIRYKLCIPEGPNEIEANVALPLEINLDLLDGLSFEKGCFIGQEVNARIKYKGLVKRKYVPIYFKNEKLRYLKFNEIDNKNIFLKNNKIGEVVALSFNEDDGFWYGIAKIKLSELYLFEKNNKLECDFYGSRTKINFPKFMLPLPKRNRTS